MERVSKSALGLVSQTEINNSLDILGNLNEQMNMLTMKNKKKVEGVASFIFFPKCRKKHSLHECQHDKIEICEIFAGSNTTKDSHHHQA